MSTDPKGGAFKYDTKVIKSPYIVGYSLDLASGVAGIRGGVGSTKQNIYVEIEFPVPSFPQIKSPLEFGSPYLGGQFLGKADYPGYQTDHGYPNAPGVAPVGPVFGPSSYTLQKIAETNSSSSLSASIKDFATAKQEETYSNPGPGSLTNHSGNSSSKYVGAGSYVGVGSSEASGAASSSSSSFSYQSNTHVTAFGGGASSAEDYYESNSSALAGSLSLAREQQTKEALRQAQDIVRRSIIVQIVAVILTETRRLFEPLARSFAAVCAQNFSYCHRNAIIDNDHLYGFSND